MKTVLFVPGFRQSLHTHDYKSLLTSVESKGYKTVFVPIIWDRTTVVDWVAQLEHEYEKHDPKNIILAGFSYGSYTAFVAAAKLNPSELWLFSLSPYFAEDIPHLKKSWKKNIGMRRVEQFKLVNFNLLTKRINCPTKIFIGEIELEKYEMLKTRCQEATKKIKQSELLVASNADHDVTNENYIKKIAESIASLS